MGEVSSLTASDLCLTMKEYGVRHIVYTDISRDGMLSGLMWRLQGSLQRRQDLTS